MSSSQQKLNADEIKKIAYLARLAITDEQAAHYAHSLSDILTLMDELQQVDTNGIEPLFSPHDRATPLRNDVSQSNIDREANQASAPAVEDGLYLVPKVIE